MSHNAPRPTLVTSHVTSLVRTLGCGFINIVTEFVTEGMKKKRTDKEPDLLLIPLLDNVGNRRCFGVYEKQAFLSSLNLGSGNVPEHRLYLVIASTR